MATSRSYLAICLFFLLWIFLGCSEKESAKTTSLVPVKITAATEKTIPHYMEWVGLTDAPTNVEIRARVEGFIQEIAFTEGKEVKTGELLFVIDPKTYDEKLANAKSKLAQSQAEYEKRHQDVERLRPLAKMRAIPLRDFDFAVANEKLALAGVEADQANVNSAQIELGYTQVQAPTDGRIGKTDVRVGSFVGRGEPTLLATISSTDKIWVTFNISETEYLKFMKEGRESGATVKDLPIQLVLADGSVLPYPGAVNFVDRNVDPKTGTLKVRVEFPNTDKLLRPGQFARVRIRIKEQPNALVVPQTAVQEIQGTYSVMVVDSEGVAHFRPVKPGGLFEGLEVIEEGLKPGEKVVTEGLQKAKDGMKVQAEEIPFPESAPSKTPTS